MLDPSALARLTPAEREILALLAEGHTAKSIAVRIGRSENAVNERLREARRKTGAGSSRELARLLRESWDEHVGMATGAVAGDVAARVGDRRRPASKGLLMALVLSLVAAAFALVAVPQAAPPASSDPSVDQAMGPAAERPEAIRACFLAEPRDATWAPAAEAVLRTRYAQVRGAARPLRVICATTLCEVAGRAADGRAAIVLFEEEVQGKSFVDRLAADGLTSMSQAFGTPRDAPQSLAYAAYWQRKR